MIEVEIHKQQARLDVYNYRFCSLEYSTCVHARVQRWLNGLVVNGRVTSVPVVAKHGEESITLSGIVHREFKTLD